MEIKEVFCNIKKINYVYNFKMVNKYIIKKNKCKYLRTIKNITDPWNQ